VEIVSRLADRSLHRYTYNEWRERAYLLAAALVWFEIGSAATGDCHDTGNYSGAILRQNSSDGNCPSLTSDANFRQQNHLLQIAFFDGANEAFRKRAQIRSRDSWYTKRFPSLAFDRLIQPCRIPQLKG
jgi:hypothetical protein